MDAAYTEAEKEYHELTTTPNHRIRRRLNNPKESPDVGSPFTEDSWNLLDQMELAASQRPTELETQETLDVVDFDAFDAVDLDQLERQALERLDKSVH